VRRAPSPVVWLAACLAAPSAAQPADRVPSVGCACETAARGEYAWYDVAETDTVRAGQYLVYVPSGYSKETPAAVFFAAHGYTSKPEVISKNSGLARVAEANNAIIVFPDGEDVGPGDGWAFPGCNASPKVDSTDCKGRRATCGKQYEFDEECKIERCPSASAIAQAGCQANETDIGCDLDDPTGNCNWCGCSDDEAFIRAVAVAVQRTFCVDASRIYMSGMSQGGMFTSWLMSRMTDVFAGFTPISGTNPRDFHEATNTTADISVLYIHGTKDTTVPIDGTADVNSDYFYYEPVADEAAKQAAYLGCSDIATSAPGIASLANAPSVAELACYEHLGCAAAPSGAARRVAYCTWAGKHIFARTESASSPYEVYWGAKMMVGYMLQVRGNDRHNCNRIIV